MGLLTLLPVSSGDASGRAITVPGLGFTLVVGIALSGIFHTKNLSTAGKWIARPLAVLLTAALLLLSPLSRLAQSYFMVHVGSRYNTMLATGPLPCRKGASVYLLNADFLASYFAPFAAAKAPNQFKGKWYQLVSTMSPVTMKRTGDNTLTLRHDGPSLINPMDRDLFTDFNTAIPKGKIVKRAGIEVVVTKRTAEGPTALSVTIPHLTDPASVCFLTLDQSRFTPVPLPKIGQSVTIPYHPPMP